MGWAADDALGQIRGVVGHPGQPARAPGVLPGQSEEIQPRAAGHAPVMRGVATAVENRNLDPPIVPTETGAPDHRSDPGVAKIQLGGLLPGCPHRRIARSGGASMWWASM